jgi:hypothetical protein
MPAAVRFEIAKLKITGSCIRERGNQPSTTTYQIKLTSRGTWPFPWLALVSQSQARMIPAPTPRKAGACSQHDEKGKILRI